MEKTFGEKRLRKKRNQIKANLVSNNNDVSPLSTADFQKMMGLLSKIKSMSSQDNPNQFMEMSNKANPFTTHFVGKQPNYDAFLGNNLNFTNNDNIWILNSGSSDHIKCNTSS